MKFDNLTLEQIKDLDNIALSEDDVGGGSIVTEEMHGIMVINSKIDKINDRLDEIERMVTQIYDTVT